MNKITIAHGSGGKITQELIQDVFFKYLDNDVLNQAGDSACVLADKQWIAFTTDSFVVKPLFFPGADIGKLSICGTVNDLAVSGAVPKYISCAFIIEEGFEKADLVEIVKSMALWAQKADVKIVAGDTKVVERGEADGLFITTAGLGVFKSDFRLSKEKIKAGDKVIITGTIGEHGLAVLSKRKGLEFDSEILSDCAPLNKMLMDVLSAVDGIRVMKDPTRGGAATTLNEIILDTKFGIIIEEEKIPVTDGVRAACELLGLDPLYIANEGKALLIVDSGCEERVLKLLRNHEYGVNAVTIGEVSRDINKVCLKTRLGTLRIIDMLSTEAIPRIC